MSWLGFFGQFCCVCPRFAHDEQYLARVSGQSVSVCLVVYPTRICSHVVHILDLLLGFVAWIPGVGWLKFIFERIIETYVRIRHPFLFTTS